MAGADAARLPKRRQRALRSARSLPPRRRPRKRLRDRPFRDRRRDRARAPAAYVGRARRRPRRQADSFVVPSTVIVGAQWGDEGKGKIVDLLAQESDIVCRYQGGPNAGHTIVFDGATYRIRQIPTGILSGKTAILGAGCVVDPEVLVAELDAYGDRGTFYVSGNAHLIMPWHLAIDRASERRLGDLQIGTTRRG